ncbi:MAG: FxLYD domain-containing protein [Nitrososphaeraceae archaeon]
MLGTRSSFLYLMLLMIILLALPLMHHGYSETTNSLSILRSSSFKDDLGYYHVVGEVKNNSTTDSMNYVKVVSTFYDNAGKVVGTDFTYTNVDVLGSAEKSSFEIILNDAQQSNHRIDIGT